MRESSSSEINLLPLVAFLALTNHAYFHRFEPKNAGRPILLLVVQPLLLLVVFGEPFSLSRIVANYLIFTSTLAVSVSVYRISPWHPLAHIPGPTVNKITKLWSVWIASGGKQHQVNKALHDKYGPFVRIGPNEVSIIHVDAVKAVLGTGGFPKGQYYEPRSDPTLPTRSLLTLRGEAHANRRRIWNRGMSSESVNEYESILAKRVAQLVARLEGLSGPVNMSEWFSYFTFDVMGDMAFGGGFEMLRDGGDKDGLWTIIENGAKNIAVVSHIPWIVSMLHMIPMATSGIKQLRKFGATCATNRIKSGSKVKDLWYHLTDEAGMEKEKPTFGEVVADGVLSIIAGSDTTGTALSCLVWFLLSNPDIYRRVQAEVDSVYPDGESSPLDATKHAELRFLTACLNETLRLQPPVPTNGTRQVPQGGGKLVAGRFIPEDTQIYIPHYSLHRSPEYFYPSPEKFDPDRWLRQQQHGEVLNLTAFIPFSYGAANCVGKSLAWREMLMVTSTLIKRFNLRFADGFQSEKWLDGLQDVFVTSIGGSLLVVLSRR
ncbi:high nitrogen upregulated cytochrome P450 monooxygenase 2 [Mycena latifolia]|nr:high nitrogen upregulated cytochrome P450 monooxygenase 2 [Mycena latifolia]